MHYIGDFEVLNDKWIFKIKKMSPIILQNKSVSLTLIQCCSFFFFHLKTVYMEMSIHTQKQKKDETACAI